jgi:hypothetical protein
MRTDLGALRGRRLTMFQAWGERRQGAAAGQWDVMLIAAAGCNWVAGSEAEFGNDAARST